MLIKPSKLQSLWECQVLQVFKIHVSSIQAAIDLIILLYFSVRLHTTHSV